MRDGNKIFQNFLKFLNNNNSLINFLAVIIIPILAIIIPTYISNHEYTLQKETTSPIFFLQGDDLKKGKSNIKIINKGGLVSYFEFVRITYIVITVNNKSISLEIEHNDQAGLSEMNANIDNKMKWDYIPTLQNFYPSEIYNIVSDKVKIVFPTKYTNVDIEDYYKLSYYDYENEYHELYYRLNEKGIGEYDKTIKPKDERKNCLSNAYMSTNSIIDEDIISFYENFQKFVDRELIQFKWRLDE